MLIATPNGRREPHDLFPPFTVLGKLKECMHVGEEKRPNFSLLDHYTVPLINKPKP